VYHAAPARLTHIEVSAWNAPVHGAIAIAARAIGVAGRARADTEPHPGAQAGKYLGPCRASSEGKTPR
jgi:hypothetical protein